MNVSLIQTVLQIVTSLMFPLLLPLLIGLMATLFAEDIIDLIRQAIAKNVGRRYR